MLITPKPGTRDPNARKSTEMLTNYDFSEQPESLRFHHHSELLSHCKDKNPATPQQDDGVTGVNYPVPDDVANRKQGGPTSRRRMK
jgi:hypothetical protein